MTKADDKTLTALIRDKAHELGFDLFGIAAPRPLSEHGTKLQDWCTAGMQSDMDYLCRNFKKRINPGLLFPGVRSVIVTGLNYYTGIKQGGDGVPVLSRYAYGSSYHDVMKGRLNRLLHFIKLNSPDTEGKAFVDSAPILEKAWAREAGLGWPGRHSVLINKELGSFFFLGVLLINRKLDYDKPYTRNYCGSCRLCIEACPTGAINENSTIDTRKCLAYLTIESKSPLPDDFVPKAGGRIFGCDRCQEVCPWNRDAIPHRVREFEIDPEVARMNGDDWLNLSAERFKRLFKKSSIGRKKYEIFMKNIEILAIKPGTS